MNENHFDKNIRNKLSDHESRVPQRVWENIQKDLEKKRTTPAFPFAVLGGVLLVAGMLAFYLFTSDSMPFDLNRTSDNAPTQVQKTNAGTKITGDERVSSNRGNSDHADYMHDNEGQSNEGQNDRSSVGENSFAETQNVNSATSKTANSSSRNVDSNSGNQANASSTSNDLQAKGNSTSNANQQFDQSTNALGSTGRSSNSEQVKTNESNLVDGDNTTSGHTSGAADQKIDAKVNPSEVDNQKSKTGQEQAKVIAIAGSQDESSQSHMNEDGSENVAGSNNPPSAYSEDEIAKILADRNVQEVRPLPSLGDGSGLSIGHFVYDPCSVKGGKKKNRVHCYSFVAERKKVFVDFEVGPQYAHKILRSRGDLEHDELLSNRRQTESYQFAYNVTARIGVKLTNGMTGMAGLSYDRIQEQFDYFDPNERRPTVTHVIQDTIVNSDNSIVVVWDTFLIESEGQRTVKHSNKLSFISIPLTAGYTWEMKKFNVGFHGGVSVNLMFEQNGRIIAPNGDVASLNGEGAKNVFKTSAGLGLLGGLIFEYHLDNGLSLLAEPRFNYQISNLTTDNYMLEQNYLNLGFNVGLRKVLYQKTIHKKKYGVN